MEEDFILSLVQSHQPIKIMLSAWRWYELKSIVFLMNVDLISQRFLNLGVLVAVSRWGCVPDGILWVDVLSFLYVLKSTHSCYPWSHEHWVSEWIRTLVVMLRRGHSTLLKNTCFCGCAISSQTRFFIQINGQNVNDEIQTDCFWDWFILQDWHFLIFLISCFT